MLTQTPPPTERNSIHRECSPPRARTGVSENQVEQVAKRALPTLSFEIQAPKVRKISTSPVSFARDISSSVDDYIIKTPEKAFQPLSFGSDEKEENSFISSSLDDDFILRPDTLVFSRFPKNAIHSRGKVAPKEIATAPIPLAETATIDTWDFNKKTYLKARSEVQGEWKITNQSGVKTSLIQTPFGEGNYAMSYLLEESSENFYPDVENKKIICKMYKDSTLRGDNIFHKETLFCSIRQYETLEQDFSGLTEEEKPYAKIYNAKTVATDGYVLQEKVIPLGKNPTWNADTHMEDLSEKDRSILEQIKKLFHYSYCKQVQKPNWEDVWAISSSSKDTSISPKTISAPGLDLWIPNLGIREGTNTVVIFDFREDDDTFPVHARQHLQNLSWRNIAIRDFLLEGLEEKVRGNADLESNYRDLITHLQG